MKIITPSVEIINQKPGLQGIYEQIELAGRTCYASSHVIEYDKNDNSITAEKFVKRMIDSKHLAMCEHGTVYLKSTYDVSAIGSWDHSIARRYSNNKYSVVNYDEYMDLKSIYVTTNLRVLIENDWLDDLQYLCEPTEYHEKRVTVRFQTDRGVSAECNRHRVDSMAERSTRYCNYSKNKFNNEITITANSDISELQANVCLNTWSENRDPFYEMCDHIAHFEGEEQFEIIDYWLFANLTCEWSYMNLLSKGWKPQQARRVLPLDLHTELVHTAFISDWKRFLDMRYKGTTGTPHPDMLLISSPLYEKLKELIND